MGIDLRAGRVAGLIILASVGSATTALGGNDPNVRVTGIQLAQGNSVPRAASVNAIVLGQNTGTTPSGPQSFTVFWCAHRQYVNKAASGAWQITPSLNNCVPATTNLVGLPAIEPGKTGQVSLPTLTAPSDACEYALVVKYRTGKNDFTNPDIAKYVPVAVTGVTPRGDPAMTATIKVEVVKNSKKKPTNVRRISVDYSIQMGVAPANSTEELVVEVCKGDRCFLKHHERPPASIFSYSKQKVGTKWVGKHVGKGTLQVDHTLESNAYYPGLPDQVRVSLGKPPASHHILEKRCDDPKLVTYAPLK